MLASLLMVLLSQAAPSKPWDSPLPNALQTPGVPDPKVTQDNIDKTICVPGYSKKVRPPVRVTSKIKKTVMRLYGYAGMDPRDFELDHLESIELAGCVDCQKNLWPQKWRTKGHKLAKEGEGAEDKDKIENELHRLVCAHQMGLEEAQKLISSDWVAAYHKYVLKDVQDEPEGIEQ